DGKCPDHQTRLTWIEEENYFFKMSKYQRWLIEHIERHPDFVRPERYRNEILGFLRDPLQDLSISRPKTRLEWGIPLPFDDTYVTYVWFDALINYVSALGGPGDPRFEKYWPHVQHVIAKDIVKAHAIYWPCMLKAAGLDLYRHLNVHGYWTLGGQKISKSVGNLVEALALKEKYGNDAFRYFVLREMVFGLDADFSEEAFVGAVNRYIDTTAPWARPASHIARGQRLSALYNAAQALWCLGVLLEPFLPEAARKIRQALGGGGVPTLRDAEWGRLAPGASVQKVSGLFPRVVDRKAAAPVPS